MDRHLTAEEVQRIADGELEMSEHVESCGRCATAILGVQQLKSAVREVMKSEPAPVALRTRLVRQSRAPWWIAAAAAVVVIAVSAVLVVRARSQNELAELVDMHVTLVGSANPVDVVSTNLHTVKPWFEGRVPFAVPIPDLSSTQFRLIGGRVVFWRGNPVAYLLIGKGPHRISVFVLRAGAGPSAIAPSFPGLSTLEWDEPGVRIVAIAGIPESDLQALRAAFSRASSAL